MPNGVTALGNPDPQQCEFLALFPSFNCPCHLILQTFDLLDPYGRAVKRECLTVLLRGAYHRWSRSRS